MIENLINTLSLAFGRVVNLVGDIFGTGTGEEAGGIFGAIEQLSSGLF